MSGCIVIGTDVGGIGDIIEHGKTGYIVKEKDSAALANVLISILGQEQEFSNMKNKTREKMMAQFDWQIIADQYALLLKSAS